MKPNKLIRLILFIILYSVVNLFNISYADSPVTIYTPRGSAVSDTYSRIEYDSATIAQLNAAFDASYPNATRLADASRTYNCHAYAWYVSEGGSNVWIGLYTSTAEDVFWTDGSYDELTESVATKVSYSGNHSAITTATAGVYISKWGSFPLARHPKNYVPGEYGSPNKFYRRSVDVPLDQSSITAAASAAVSGQTILVSPGTYNNENISISNKNAITIQGSSPYNTVINGSLSVSNTSNFLLSSIKLQNGGISLNNCSTFNFQSINSYQGSSPISLTGSYGQIYGSISQNSSAGIYCYDSDCNVVDGSDIKSEGIGAWLTNTSIGYLEYITLCNNTWDIYTDGTSTGYGDASAFSGNPANTTYGNVTYSNYTICSWPKRMPSTNLFTKDPAFDDFVRASSSYFALFKKIHTENKDAVCIDYSKYASEYSTIKDNFNSFITQNPNSGLAKTSLSAITHIYRAMNDYEGMKAYLDATVNNKNLSSLNGLARKYMMDYYCNQKDFTQALAIADGILNEKSTNTDLICYVLYSKGLIYQYSLDQKEEAQKIYDSIITNYPDDASVELAKIQLKGMGVEVKENKKAAETAAMKELKFDSSNYPNPFNPSTTISYSIPEVGKVVVKIFDVLGRELATLVNDVISAGAHSVLWNGNNFASGIYFYNVTYKNQTLYKKMLLIK
jgi:tetratricopeptide (TPR) repeat protein